MYGVLYCILTEWRTDLLMLLYRYGWSTVLALKVLPTGLNMMRGKKRAPFHWGRMHNVWPTTLACRSRQIVMYSTVGPLILCKTLFVFLHIKWWGFRWQMAAKFCLNDNHAQLPLSDSMALESKWLYPVLCAYSCFWEWLYSNPLTVTQRYFAVRFGKMSRTKGSSRPSSSWDEDTVCYDRKSMTRITEA